MVYVPLTIGSKWRGSNGDEYTLVDIRALEHCVLCVPERKYMFGTTEVIEREPLPEQLFRDCYTPIVAEEGA